MTEAQLQTLKQGLNFQLLGHDVKLTPIINRVKGKAEERFTFFIDGQPTPLFLDFKAIDQIVTRGGRIAVNDLFKSVVTEILREISKRFNVTVNIEAEYKKIEKSIKNLNIF